MGYILELKNGYDDMGEQVFKSSGLVCACEEQS